jgi:hypothetical protein
MLETSQTQIAGLVSCLNSSSRSAALHIKR